MSDGSQYVNGQNMGGLSILSDVRHYRGMAELAGRLKAAIARSGKTQLDIESEAELGKGYLSHLLSGRTKKLGYEKARAIAAATGVSTEWLLSGTEVPDAASGHPTGKVAPPLEQLDGYADAELIVARQEPSVPVDVFRQARQARIAAAPSPVTPEFLRGLVLLLAAQGQLTPGQAAAIQDRANRHGVVMGGTVGSSAGPSIAPDRPAKRPAKKLSRRR